MGLPGDGHARNGSIRWIVVSIAALAFLVLGLLQYRTLKVLDRSNGESETAGLGLKTNRSGTLWHLNWSRNAPAVLTATRARLSITDGPNRNEVDLDASELRIGSIAYSPTSPDVTFRLEVFDLARGRSVSESVRVLAGPAPLAASAPTAAVSPPQAGAARRQPAQSASVADGSSGTRPAAARQVAPRQAAAAGVATRPVEEAAPEPAQPVAANAARVSEPAPPAPPPAAQAVAPFGAREPVEVARETSVQRLRSGTVPVRTAEVAPAPAAPAPAAAKPAAAAPAKVLPASAPPAGERPPERAAAEPSAAAAPPMEVKVGGDVRPAVLIRKRDPIYPLLARQSRISGIVRLAVTIGTDGRVRGAKVVSGHPVLHQEAIDAVRQWLYQPALLNGVPIEVVYTVNLNFRLGER
jgi:protein TonB